MQQNYRRAVAGDVIENFRVVADDSSHRAELYARSKFRGFARSVPEVEHFDKLLAFVKLVINDYWAVHQLANLRTFGKDNTNARPIMQEFDVVEK